jgi:hypothetical protein
VRAAARSAFAASVPWRRYCSQKLTNTSGSLTYRLHCSISVCGLNDSDIGSCFMYCNAIIEYVAQQKISRLLGFSF